MQIVEWAPFRVKEGVEREQLIAASDALQAQFLANQPGFLHRELLEGKDGNWVDLVHWADEASMHVVMGAVAESAVCNRYFALMQGADHADPGAGVLQYQVVKPYWRG